jgi:hypothetical protein
MRPRPYGVGQATTFGIVRPNDHPVRTNRDSWTCSIERIGIAVLRSTTQHVDKTRGRIRGLGLLGPDVHYPLQAHRIGAHRNIADLILISGKADPIVGALINMRARALKAHDRSLPYEHAAARRKVKPTRDYATLIVISAASGVTASAFGFLTFIRQSARPDRYGGQRVLTQSTRSKRTSVLVKTIADRRESYCPRRNQSDARITDAFRPIRATRVGRNPCWFSTYESNDKWLEPEAISSDPSGHRAG